MLRQKDYPKQLLIRCNVWEVRFCRMTPDGVPKHVGLCENDEKRISIKMGQPPKERLKTFIHELLHAVDYEYDLNLPHPLIYSLEEPIARFLIDNLL